jgi:hypothetical protein
MWLQAYSSGFIEINKRYKGEKSSLTKVEVYVAAPYKF